MSSIVIYLVRFVFFADVFRQFLESDVDAKALASRAIQGLAISQQLAKLADGINTLDRELHSQVNYNFPMSLSVLSLLIIM